MRELLQMRTGNFSSLWPNGPYLEMAMSDNPDCSDGLCEHPLDDPAAVLSKLWREGQAPNVFTFLADSAPLSAEQCVNALCVDQCERWLRGERPLAEAYLEFFRSLHDDEEYAVDLLYNEYRLRRRLGETPSLDEFHGRFPELADQLILQVEMEVAVNPSDSAAETILLRAGGETPSPSALCDPVPASPIPGYTLERVLGRGGMGVVFLAQQQRLRRPVALKMLRTAVLANEGDRLRFRAEAESAARLQHPHIVQVFETGEHEGRPFLVMELVEGISLAQRLAEAPLDARAATEVLESLARAVHYAHSRGIIHRDLKPANVLLLPNGTPKLTDFGLARRLDGDTALTLTGQVLGTPSYMAPEQAAGKNEQVGPAADVYALGAVFYECLTGRPPFKGTTAYETVLQVLHEDPVSPRRLRPVVPRDLETICVKCLEKNPDRRYASAEEVAEDLRRFLEGRPVIARPVGVIGRVARWAVRRPVAAALMAAVLVAVFAFVSYGFWSVRDHSIRKAEAREKIATALQQAEELRQQTRWTEAMAALQDAELQLGIAGSDELRQGLERAKEVIRQEVDGEVERIRKDRVPQVLTDSGTKGREIEHKNVAFDIAKNGEDIVFSAADGDLYVLHIPISRVSRLTETPDEESTPKFSPNGQSIVYVAGPSNGGAKSIFVRSLDGKSVERLTNGDGVTDRSPSFSPDGKYIVFARANRNRQHSMGGRTWDDWDVYVMRSDGTQLQRVTQLSYFSLDSPRFSHDGESVIYSADVRHSEQGMTTVVFEAKVSGSEKAKQLSAGPPRGQFGAWASQPAISVTGKSVVVVSDRDTSFLYDLIAMNRDGSGPRPLGVTSVSRYNQNPVFAADGKSIFFLAGTEWNASHRPIYSLWRVDTDGKHPRRVADSDLFTSPLSWKPRP